MKNAVFTSILAAGFAALLFNTPAAAQTKQQATIPFTFEAGGVEYPEGHYSVEHLGNTRVIRIMNLTNGRAALVNAPVLSGLRNSGGPKLVFNQTGDRMQLSEVWFSDLPGMLTIRSKEVSAKVAVALK